MAAAPDVGGGGDRVRGFDRGLDRGRRVGGDARLAFGDEVGALAGGQRGRCGRRRRAAGGGHLFGDAGEVVAQRLRAGLEPVEGFAAFGLGRLQFVEPFPGAGAGGGRFALLDGDRVARFLDLAPDPGHPFHRGLGLVAQRLDPAGDGVVVVLDLAQVVGAGVDFRPAGRFEDDVDDVGLAGLIDRDQPFAQHLERPAQTRPDDRQPLLVGLELGAGPLEFGLLVGEFGFERGLALAQDGDFAEHRVDRRVLLGDRRAQRVFALADLVELALGRVELFLQGLGGGGPAGSPERNDGEQRGSGQQPAPRIAREGGEHRRRTLTKPRLPC